MITPIIILCFIGIVSLLAAASVKRIPEGQVYSLHRRGRPQPRLLAPGVHLVLPLIERIAHKISLGGHTLKLDEPVATENGVIPHALCGSVYWQVLEPQRAEAVIEHVDEMIRSCALQALAADLVEGSPRNMRLKQALNAQLRERGMLVTRVDLQPVDNAG